MTRIEIWNASERFDYYFSGLLKKRTKSMNCNEIEGYFPQIILQLSSNGVCLMTMTMMMMMRTTTNRMRMKVCVLNQRKQVFGARKQRTIEETLWGFWEIEKTTKATAKTSIDSCSIIVNYAILEYWMWKEHFTLHFIHLFSLPQTSAIANVCLVRKLKSRHVWGRLGPTTKQASVRELEAEKKSN